MSAANDSPCPACATPGKCLPRDLDTSVLPPGRYRRCSLVSTELLIISAPPVPMLEAVDTLTDAIAELVDDHPTIGLDAPLIGALPLVDPAPSAEEPWSVRKWAHITPMTGTVQCNGCGKSGTGRRYDSAGGPQCLVCLARRHGGLGPGTDYVTETPIPNIKWAVCVTPRCGRSAMDNKPAPRCGTCDPGNALALPEGRYRTESGQDLIVGNGVYHTPEERARFNAELAGIIDALNMMQTGANA